MNQSGRVARHWDEKAESFDGIYSGQKSRVGRLWDRLTRRNIGDRFVWTLAKLGDVTEQRLLDVGCGSGRLAVELAERGARQVVGLDVATHMLELARTAARDRGVAERCDFISEDALTAQLEGPFDAAFSLGVFDYVTEPSALLRRMVAVTPGLILISFPTRWSLRAPARWISYRLRSHPLRLYSRKEILRLCAAEGLASVEITRSGPIYLLAARVSSA
jgi:cyclopropane fatty-acyl-phospholipid synthase-like methyltransferase